MMDQKEAKISSLSGTLDRNRKMTKGSLKMSNVKDVDFIEEHWEEISKDCDWLQEEEELIENEPITEDFLIYKPNEKTGEQEVKGVNIDKVSDHLISQHEFKTWFGIKSDYCFNFDGRIYNKNSRGIIKADCEELLNVYCRKNIVEEVFEKVKRKTKVDREEFEKVDNNLICLENGIWDIQNKKLVPHSKDYNFKTFIPITYDESASCPNFLKYLGEALYPEDIPVIQEWFGFNLYREYFIKKAVICVGDSDTGKSVLLDTMVEFIGEKNKTGLSLQKISSGSDFNKLSLKDKHSNIYDDLSSKDLNDGGAFKVATGGGYISGEEKFGEYHQFKSFAKQMFATNKIPPVKDNDDLAYFGRWIILRFDNVPEKIDPFLRNKIHAPEELSGILNWALEGLYRLLGNSKFSYANEPVDIKTIMEISGCPLVAFSQEVLEKQNGNVITKEDMFQVYSLWCEEQKRPRLSKEMLGRQLTKYCNYILPGKQKERIWENARIKEEYKIKLEESVGSGETILNTDTSDTSQNNMRNYREVINNDSNMVYIKSEKVSEVVKKDDSDYQKLEAQYKKEGLI